MRLRDLIGRISFNAGHRSTMQDLRRLVVGTAAAGRKGELAAVLRGMTGIEQTMAREHGTWLEPEDVGNGASGNFDVCDLRIWLRLAEEAGIPHVPAKPLLSVTEAELERLLDPIGLPEAMAKNAGKHIEAAILSDPELSEMRRALEDAEPGPVPGPERIAEIAELMETVLDGIPPSWMVRTHVSGSQNLKALVGTGLMLKGDDTAELAPGIKAGAGWVQVGNRRLIDWKDKRFIEMVATGHKPVTHYLARPWEEPARFHEGEDLHRSGSPLAGPGKWPAEWRVFVRNGEVTGTANYYGWTGEGETARNAWNAIEAAVLAQDLVDHVSARGLVGRFMDTVLARANTHPQTAAAFRAWEPDGLHATIDMIETGQGLKLLEAGPGHMPGGGGHPCAFAGQGVEPGNPERLVAACEGVAYRCMPHVDLGDPRTWVDGDQAGSIASWASAAALAAGHAPLGGRAMAFLERRGVTFNDHPEP